MPRTPACRGTCVRDLSCTGCARCYPRYICADVVVTPGIYTDPLDCCDPDSYGQGHFGFRLTKQCSGYSASGTCTGLDTSLDLSVEIIGSWPDCQTVVSSSLSDSTYTFDGLLPAGMNGEFEAENGDLFEWELSSADVIENPLIKYECSPCTCTTLLPRRLCLVVTADGDAYLPELNEALSFLWNCNSSGGYEIDGELPEGFTAAITLKPIDEGICGLNVSFGGDYGTYEGEIVFEGPTHPRKIHGTICKDSDDLEMTLGVPELLPCDPPTPCEDPPPQEWVSFIDETIALMDGETQTGTVTIRDQSCGECVVADCTQTACCEDSLPETLHITATVGDWSVLSFDPVSQIWNASATICGVVYSVRFFCDITLPSITNTHWWIQPYCDGTVANSASEAVTAVCDPFYVKFTFVFFNVDECSCDGSPDRYLIDFEITA